MIKKQLKKTIDKLVEGSFTDGKMIEGKVIKAIKLLKSLGKTDAILAMSEYLSGLKRIERKHTMYIETAITLSLSQIKKAKKIVEKRVKITKIKTVVNPDLLGGFKLKVGDEVWDESVLEKLNQIKEGIAHGRPN